MSVRARRFETVIVSGHKGEAVIVPFDPAEVWDLPQADVPRPWKRGWLVRGSIAGQDFEGWIGLRWGRFFILVDADLQERAGVRAGDTVEVKVRPR